MANGRRQRKPSLSISSSNGRNRRLKQEDIDDADDMAPSGAPVSTTTNGRGKRKAKDKTPLTADIVATAASEALGDDIAIDVAGEGVEEPSVTRCVCGSNGESILVFVNQPAHWLGK
jgi:hypothetical protein